MQWIKATERLPKSGDEVFIKIEGTRSIGAYKKHHDLFMNVSGDFFPADQVEWLDEADDWIAVDGDNYPVDTPIIIEHKHGYDAVRLYQGEWRYCYANEPVRDILLNSILTTAKRYLIASTPQGGDNTIK